MFKITVNGAPITLNDTGGESRGGKRLVTAEVQSENGDKLYIKGYLTQNGSVKDVTKDVEVFDSKSGKVARTKKEAKQDGANATQTMIENMVAAALAKALAKV